MPCVKKHCVKESVKAVEDWLKEANVQCLSGIVERLDVVASAVMRQEQLIPVILDLSGSSLKRLTGCSEIGSELAEEIAAVLEKFIGALVSCFGGKAYFGRLKYASVPTMVVEIELPWGHVWFNWALDYHNDALRLEYYHFESRC